MAKERLEDNIPGEPPMTPMIDVIFQLLIFFMVTLKFSAAEGKLLAQLPRRGHEQHETRDLVEPIRIILCSGGSEAELRRHRGHSLHASAKGAVTLLWVEGGSTRPLGSGPESRGALDAAAAEAARLHQALPERPPIQLDVDAAVPYEQVVGILDALQRRSIHAIEFAAASGLKITPP